MSTPNEKQIQKYGEELEILENRIKTDVDYSIPYRTSSKEVLEVLQNPYTVWENYDVYQKQKFFYFIFEENLRYDKKEGYRTPNYSLPITLFETITNKEPNEVDIVVKSSNPLRTFILQWAEFFKYNPPTTNYILNKKNNLYK